MTTRRSGRSNRRAKGGRPLEAEFEAVFLTGDYRFLASAYNIDGGTGNVASFYNTLNAAQTVAATGAQQAAPPAASANFNGALSATFGGSTRYDSNQAASVWNFRHDGTGCTEYAVIRPTSAASLILVHSTMRSQDAGTTNGAVFGYRTSGTNGLFYRVGRSASPTTIESDVAASIANGTACYIGSSYKESVSPEYTTRYKSTLVTSGNSQAAPSAGNASVTLRIGSNGVTTDFGFVGEWVESIFIKRYLTPYEHSVLHRYWLAIYGVTP